MKKPAGATAAGGLCSWTDYRGRLSSGSTRFRHRPMRDPAYSGQVLIVGLHDTPGCQSSGSVSRTAFGIWPQFCA
jgi:hypothetical protein